MILEVIGMIIYHTRFWLIDLLYKRVLTLMFGREVRLPVDIMYGDRQSSIGSPTCPIEYVEWVCNTMQNAYRMVTENLQKSAVRQKQGYDLNTSSMVIGYGCFIRQKTKTNLVVGGRDLIWLFLGWGN